MGRSLDLQPLNPLDFHTSQIWRHRIHHGYHSNVAPWVLAINLDLENSAHCGQPASDTFDALAPARDEHDV